MSEFWTLAADFGRNEPTLQGVFLQGLNECLQDEHLLQQKLLDLYCIVDLAISLDNHPRTRRQGRAPSHPTAPSVAPVLFSAHLGPSNPGQVAHIVPSDAPTTAEQSMQLGRARLIPEECHRRIGAGECLYCIQQVTSFRVVQFDQKSEPVSSCGGTGRPELRYGQTPVFGCTPVVSFLVCWRSSSSSPGPARFKPRMLDQELAVHVGCVLEPLPLPYTAIALDCSTSPHHSQVEWHVHHLGTIRSQSPSWWSLLPGHQWSWISPGCTAITSDRLGTGQSDESEFALSLSLPQIGTDSRSEFSLSKLPTNTPWPFWGARAISQPPWGV